MTSSDLETARAVAVRFLAYSARSCTEIERRLEKGGFDPDIIAVVVEELKQKDYLNDGKFSEDWISDRADRKRYGKSRLTAELQRKGLDTETIREAIASVSPDDELRRALAAAEARHPFCGDEALDAEQTQANNRRLAAFLQRRGFDWSIVKQVLAQRAENR